MQEKSPCLPLHIHRDKEQGGKFRESPEMIKQEYFAQTGSGEDLGEKIHETVRQGTTMYYGSPCCEEQQDTLALWGK